MAKIKSPKLKCKGIIKLVLITGDWFSYDELRDKANDIYNSQYPEHTDIRQDTFTKSINSLLANKDILIKRGVISEDEYKYNTKKDKIKYYFKLNSNPSFSVAPKMDVTELLKLLKDFDTVHFFRQNNINEIESHYLKNLEFEVESYNVNDFSEQTHFLIDVYKSKNPQDAYINYLKLNSFNNDTSYKDLTKESYIKEIMDCYDFESKFKIYSVNSGNSKYINTKFMNAYNYLKCVFLVDNLTIVIYYYMRYNIDNLKDYKFSINIFNVIYNYLKFLKAKRK